MAGAGNLLSNRWSRVPHALIGSDALGGARNPHSVFSMNRRGDLLKLAGEARWGGMMLL